MKLQLRKILSVCLVLCLMFCMCAVGTIHPSAASEAEEYKYYDYFKDFYDSYYGTTGDEFWTDYIEEYEYYSNGNPSDEATPDFAVVFCCSGYEFASGPVIFGDYILYTALNYPYILGLYVITLDDGRIYTLTEAYTRVDGIEEMLEEWYRNGTISRIGDVDQDHKLTVKDATLIQKSVAGLATIKDDEIYYNIVSRLKDGVTPNARHMLYKSDFNYDYKRNVKDATALQKHIAGLDY